MASDEITMLEPELASNDGKSVRLFAYACAMSRKDRGASSSYGGKADSGSGITGLRKELEKTKLDV